MKFLFIDETEKFGYFGVSAILIDSTKYSSIATNILNAINSENWSQDKEFKSICIFSSSNGDINISIDDRKKIATKIIKSNVSSSNATIKCFFAYKHGRKTANNYKKLLEKIFSKVSRAPTSRQGKNLITVFFDQLDYSNQHKQTIFSSTIKLKEKNYVITEHPVEISSSNLTPGVIFADHIAFISMWHKLNATTRNREISNIKQKKNEYIQGLVEELRHIKIMGVIE